MKPYNKIQLYWWTEKIKLRKDSENFGAAFGRYLTQKISNKTVVYPQPQKISFLDSFALIVFPLAAYYLM